MSKMSFLEIQYNLSKRKFLRKPSHLFSFRDRQSSDLKLAFEPNLDEMKQVFDKFDSNRDGKISQQEYKAMLRAMGKDHMIGDVPNIFKVVDLDGDGFINFKEFMDVQKKGGGVRTSDIQGAFRTFDLNGDGKISPDEVLAMLRKLGERCTIEDCKRMVRAVDTDGDGMVNMDEFMTMMTQNMQHG